MANWVKFDRKTVFVSCSYDMLAGVPVVEAAVRDINQRLPVADRWDVYHWTNGDSGPWPADGTWQERIPRTSDPKAITICLLGERIGQPLPAYFPLPDDLPLPSFIVPPGKRGAGVPLTGTVFELLDATLGPRGPNIKNRVYCYIKGPGNLISRSVNDVRAREYGFNEHFRALHYGRSRPTKKDEDDYDQQMRWLDRLVRVLFQDADLTYGGRPAIYFGSKEGPIEDLRRILARDLPLALGVPTPATAATPKGLTAYQADDADFLFGRDAAIEELLNDLKARSQAGVAPILLLTGRSGEGKSSLLRAGLIGRLQKGYYSNYGKFQATVIEPAGLVTEEAFPALTSALESCLGPLWTDHQLGDFVSSRRAFKLAESVLHALDGRSHERLFLGFDQFEELLNDAETEGNANNRLDELLELIRALLRTGRVWVVLALPSDRVLQLNARAPDFAGKFILEPVGGQEIREIVHNSLKIFRLPLDRRQGLVTQVERWLSSQMDPGPVLPLLSMLLQEWVDSRGRAALGNLNHDSSDQALDLGGVMDRLGEAAIIEAGAFVGSEDQAFARLLRHLVITRIGRETIKDLTACSDQHPAIVGSRHLVGALRRRRLLYSGTDGFIRLAHIRVLEHWARAREWYESDVDKQVALAELQHEAAIFKGAVATGQLYRRTLDAGKLSRIGELWWQWRDDQEVIPVEFFITCIQVKLRERNRLWWRFSDGASVLTLAIAVRNEFLLGVVIRRMKKSSHEEQRNIVNHGGPKGGTTALHMASWNRDHTLVRRLLTAGADADKADRQGLTALHWAAQRSDEVTLRLLLNTSPGLAVAQSKDGKTALHLAATVGDIGVARTLIERDPRLATIADEVGAIPLHYAASAGHTALVALLIENRSQSLFCTDKDALTPLHYAVHKDASETMVKMLLDAGPELAVRGNSKGATPLVFAAMDGHVAIVRLLLERSLRSALIPVENGMTALHAAAGEGHELVVRLLLDVEPTLSGVADNEDATALHVAAERGDGRIAGMLLGVDSSLASRSTKKNGYTALHLAARKGHIQVARVLLDANPELATIRCGDGSTALHEAAFFGHDGVVELLLECDSGLAALPDIHGMNALHAAAMMGHESVVRHLLEVAPSLAASTTDEDVTPVGLAAYGGHSSVVEVLLDRGLSTDVTGAILRTALLAAAGGGRAGIVKQVLDLGANVQTRGYGQRTAMHSAASGGHDSIVSYLLELGADVNSRDDQNWTPLHVAAAGGHLELVKLLLAHNADFGAETDRRATALLLAAEHGHESVVRLLVAEGGVVDTAQVRGWRPLHQAAANGHLAVVEFLLDCGASIGASEDSGATPLHLAAGNGRMEVVGLLLGRGVEIDGRDHALRTPLHVAAADGHEEVVNLLLGRGAVSGLRDAEGNTAAQLAAAAGHLTVQERLTLHETMRDEAVGESGSAVAGLPPDNNDGDRDLTAFVPAERRAGSE